MSVDHSVCVRDVFVYLLKLLFVYCFCWFVCPPYTRIWVFQWKTSRRICSNNQTNCKQILKIPRNSIVFIFENKLAKKISRVNHWKWFHLFWVWYAVRPVVYLYQAIPGVFKLIFFFLEWCCLVKNLSYYSSKLLSGRQCNCHQRTYQTHIHTTHTTHTKTYTDATNIYIKGEEEK